MRSIISISLTGLENIGLRKILENIPMVILECIDNFSIDSIDADKYDLLITTPDVIIKHIDYFLPLRSKTIVLTNGCAENRDSFRCVSVNSDVEHYIETFIEALEYNTNRLGSNKLSNREIEVLVELASGKTQKEIADSLCISLTTVISHRKNISAKLGIRSISGLALYAAINGYIKN